MREDFVIVTDYLWDGNLIVGYLYWGDKDAEEPSYILSDGDVYTRSQLEGGEALGGTAHFVSYKEMDELAKDYLKKKGLLKDVPRENT